MIHIMCDGCGGRIKIDAEVHFCSDGVREIFLVPPREDGRLYVATGSDTPAGIVPVEFFACSARCMTKLAEITCDECRDNN